MCPRDSYWVSMSLSQAQEDECNDLHSSSCLPLDLLFVMNSESDVDSEMSKPKSKSNAYAELFPIFKEMIQHL